jgi:hypothetical protein
MKTNTDPFAAALKPVINNVIACLPADTVGISQENLWALVVRHVSNLPGAYKGTNAAYFARHTFNQVVSKAPFNKFVYA